MAGDRTTKQLRDASRDGRLVRVVRRKGWDHLDECLIGLPHSFKRRKFRLQNVTTSAEWDDDSVFRYRSVTRIDLGGAYERRLAAVAGPAPCPVHGPEPHEHVSIA